jgi:hypothetical protein
MSFPWELVSSSFAALALFVPASRLLGRACIEPQTYKLGLPTIYRHREEKFNGVYRKKRQMMRRFPEEHADILILFYTYRRGLKNIADCQRRPSKLAFKLIK